MLPSAVEKELILRTRLTMTGSAIFLLILGLATTFAPQELLHYTNTAASPATVLLEQAAGALYLGFAILNWMAKDNTIGGIYSRPVALGNFLHFLMMTLTLLRVVAAGQTSPPVLLITALYTVFAVLFGLLVFGRSPIAV